MALALASPGTLSLGPRPRRPPRASAKGRADALPGPRVLVVPGYLIDASAYVPLVRCLRRRGFAAALPPVRWHNWLPTVGGRSLRPILDRLDYALSRLVAGDLAGPEDGYEVRLPAEPTWADWAAEFREAYKGARPPLEAAGPMPGIPRKACLVASSASGWICRILLGGDHEYWGVAYHGRDRVRTLLTLGTPHACSEAVSKKNIEFVNGRYPGCFEDGVKYVCVAGTAVRGKVWGGLLRDFAYQSYELCLPGQGGEIGDGVTPVEAALALEGAERVVLDGVWHQPSDAHGGRLWYGSEEVVGEWEGFLRE